MRESQALFERHRVGIWLAYEKSNECARGLLRVSGARRTGPIRGSYYAMPGRFSGKRISPRRWRGASIAQVARTPPGGLEMVADIDEISHRFGARSRSPGSSRPPSGRQRSATLLLLRLAAGR